MSPLSTSLTLRAAKRRIDKFRPSLVSPQQCFSTIAIQGASPDEATQLAEWMEQGRGGTVVLCGAGLSTDSGIPDYRGPNGIYVRNATYKPIMYQSFVSSHTARQRYWARSYYGFNRVERASPNAAHAHLARLFEAGLLLRGVDVTGPHEGGEKAGHVAVPSFVTQNVDGLQQKAGVADSAVLELHGSLRDVHCVSCGHQVGRKEFQTELERLNPNWPPATQTAPNLLDGAQEAIMGAERGAGGAGAGTGSESGSGSIGSGRGFLAGRTPMPANDGKDVFGAVPLTAPVLSPLKAPAMNPDGDADIVVDFSSWKYPACTECGGVMKPGVVFFGENLPRPTRDLSFHSIAHCSRLLVLGTSLAVLSALRLVRAAVEAGKPVAIVNVGPTRADALSGVRKWERGVGGVLGEVVERVSR
ncbi:DHS-like NAD/FAD-binding domain-containing protein [Gonapodya prolifera JEL478]|uniref:DHS-like NAD/FAD-binding domain-containing protein n=1 Tax=Gonapodya prolifera (strain JEL478) TaxID=1344416 RepID=A0A139ARH4_GONPJ|nr:DHS-like NAD/FAD-binding domain-containing protein [Gonapodya prolifera JEL478]|eukprot:KXS19322.1 DHS-like NAD/FAD-binding domain-containing protein [Gonapodya prolifera JEL478]